MLCELVTWNSRPGAALNQSFRKTGMLIPPVIVIGFGPYLNIFNLEENGAFACANVVIVALVEEMGVQADAGP